MRNLFDINTIHIEVTNACNLECANCTRFIGHHRKNFFITMDQLRKALSSLEGFKGNIGIMGGEPTLHPKFEEICNIVQEMIPNQEQRALWTNGFKWKKYEDIIHKTFPNKYNIIYNEHGDPNEVHHPLLLAAKDVVEDKETMWKLIDKCWINERWAASITPKGGFFCEVAAAQDLLFDGPGGYDIEKGWWNKSVEEYRDQVERYCVNCSAAVPLPPKYDILGKDLVSPNIAKILKDKNSRRCSKGNIKVFEETFSNADIEENSKGWMPWSHRDFKQYSPELIIYER